MAKDINIHVKVDGAEETKRKVAEVAEGAKQSGEKMADGQKAAGEASEKTTEKLGGMGRILVSLKAQVLSFVGALLGIEGVQRVIGYVITQLERIQRLQADIYDKSLSLQQLGQSLAIQTGEPGAQQKWSEQILSLQAAGALESPAHAAQMLKSADVTFAEQGGIKNKSVMDILTALAPAFGAWQLSPDQIAKVFAFAGTAGVAPTVGAYKDYMAKLLAGFRAAKSNDTGAFLAGLQKGGTAYISQGGTLEEAISGYSAALSVMPNEQQAATLIEMVARVSSGGYPKPRAAMEKKFGVEWSALSMDQRMSTLLSYMSSLPESSRSQLMVEAGFDPTMASEVTKMVTPEAQRKLSASRLAVSQATPETIDAIIDAWLTSPAGKALTGEAERQKEAADLAPKLQSWQERLKDARAKFDIMLAEGTEDPYVWNKVEPFVLALDKMYTEAQAIDASRLSKEDAAKLAELTEGINVYRRMLRSPVTGLLTPETSAYKTTQRMAGKLEALQQTVINNYVGVQNFPTVGRDATGEPGPRVPNTDF